MLNQKVGTIHCEVTAVALVRSRRLNVKVRVVVVEHAKMQDGSADTWPADVVASHVQTFVRKFELQTVRRSG